MVLMKAKTILIIKDAYLSEETTGWIPSPQSGYAKTLIRYKFREI